MGVGGQGGEAQNGNPSGGAVEGGVQPSTGGSNTAGTSAGTPGSSGGDASAGAGGDKGGCLGSEIVLPGTKTDSPSIVATSFGFAVAYLDMVSPGESRVALVRYDNNGARLGSIVDVETKLGGPPIVAWNGKTIAVVWAENYNGSGVYFRSFSADGVASGPAMNLAPVNPQARPVLYASGSNFVTVYTDYVPKGASRLATIRVDELGEKLGTEVDISTSTSRVDTLTGVFSDSGGSLYYSDSRTTAPVVYRRTLDHIGNAVGSEVLVIPGTVWASTSIGIDDVLTVNSFNPTDPANSSALTKDRVVKVNGEGLAVAAADFYGPSLAAYWSYPGVASSGSRLFILTGLTLESRDNSFAKKSGPFGFAADVQGGGYYAAMAVGTSLVAGVVGFDGPTGMAVLRFLSKDGCN